MHISDLFDREFIFCLGAGKKLFTLDEANVE